MSDAHRLATLDGWHSEGYAARVHYEGSTDRYSIEFYGPSDSVLYWAVDSDDSAVPVSRESVPDPLRERIRQDLAEVGIDPDIEDRTL